jgi:DNA-binding transcriptional ArsR family regulator
LKGLRSQRDWMRAGWRRVQEEVAVERRGQFVYDASMNASVARATHEAARAMGGEAFGDTDTGVSRVAAAIGEPARARMLCCLMDGHARTSTELAIVAEVSPSTASVHLQRLVAQRLVRVAAQGKHRYYSLEGARVARILEGLSVIAGDGAGHGARRARFVPKTPSPLRAARTCYDHMAGSLGVAVHDRMTTLGWLTRHDATHDTTGAAYDVSSAGMRALSGLGVDVEAVRGLRRRFAFACLDWSERRPHVGGALGAALLGIALKRKWVVQDLDSRALEVTSYGRREMMERFGVRI